MTMTTIAGHQVHLDEEGFMTDPGEWAEEMAATLAGHVGIIELTPDHWKVIHFLRDDYEAAGETPTLRAVSIGTGIATKDLFALFPKKPAKKMAYVAGLPKPKGCI